MQKEPAARQSVGSRACLPGFFARGWSRLGGSDLLAVGLMHGFGGVPDAERPKEDAALSGFGEPSRGVKEGQEDAPLLA